MPTVGLSMIVKNEAQTLGHCLQSVSGVVSQIVVADTGSTDNTADIAREFGATVISVPWENHFANARNAALALMQTDWVLVLDADEELDDEARNQIPNLLAVERRRIPRSHSQLHPDHYRPGMGPGRRAEQEPALPRPACSRHISFTRTAACFAAIPRSILSGACMNWSNPDPCRGAATVHGEVLHSSLRPAGAGRSEKGESGSLSRPVAHEGSRTARRCHGLDPARPSGIRVLPGASGAVALLRACPGTWSREQLPRLCSRE